MKLQICILIITILHAQSTTLVPIRFKFGSHFGVFQSVVSNPLQIDDPNTQVRFHVAYPTVRELIFKNQNAMKFIPLGLGKIFPNLESLIFDDCALEKIDNTDFEGLTAITKLTIINGKSLRNISNDSFSSLKNLKYLNLSHNSLTNIEDEAFLNLENLENLDVSGNKLKKLEGNLLAKNLKLTSISFRNNKISYIESKLFENLENVWVQLKGNKCINENIFGSGESIENILVEKSCNNTQDDDDSDEEENVESTTIFEELDYYDVEDYPADEPKVEESTTVKRKVDSKIIEDEPLYEDFVEETSTTESKEIPSTTSKAEINDESSMISSRVNQNQKSSTHSRDVLIEKKVNSSSNGGDSIMSVVYILAAMVMIASSILFYIECKKHKQFKRVYTEPKDINLKYELTETTV